MKKKLMAFGLVLLMAASVVGCGNKGKTTEKTEQKTEEKQLSDFQAAPDAEGYSLAADNEGYELYVSEDGSGIRVKDKVSNEIWDSKSNADGFDTNSVNVKWQKKLFSPFELFYTDLDKGQGAVINLTLLEMDYSTEFYKIDGGVRVVYDMVNPGVALSIDYMIDENGLVVEIPTSEIEEKGKYSVTSIKMLPYLADATDKEEGYYFYPDGSGAIMEFKDSSHYRESELALKMYGDLLKYKNTLDVLDEKSGEVLLPVYGVSLPNKGFLAIIEQGAETSTIKVLPTTEVIAINSISCEFAIRRSFSDARAEEAGFLVFDDEMIEGTRRISYRFYHDGATTYTDMAKTYRNYLINEEGIEVKEATETIPLSLDLFMGIKEDGLLFDEFKCVTTFAQAQKILEELQEAGVKSVDLQLKGWTKKGYFTDPKMFPVNSKVGGKSGLKDLTAYAKDKDIEISLEANFLEARAEVGGFNEREDVIYLGNNTIFSNYDSTLFLMNPSSAKKNLEEFIDDAEAFDIDGVSFYSLGQYLLYNYSTTQYTTQDECVDIWQDMLKQSKEAFGKAVVQGGNSYVLAVADKVTDVPDEDSGYQMTTSGVPFYQIATRGLVECTGKAGNLSSDIDAEKLKWIEYGMTPYFELTYSGSEDLMYTDYSTLFSSTYTDWLDQAVEIYTDFNENLTGIWNAAIEDHEEVKDGVFKVTYDNGKIVYVNYNSQVVTVDGVKIQAKDYAVKEG